MKRNNSVIERDRQSSKKCRLKFSSLTSLSYFVQDLKDVSEQSKRSCVWQQMLSESWFKERRSKGEYIAHR